jgi:hypothetical protein
MFHFVCTTLKQTPDYITSARKSLLALNIPPDRISSIEYVGEGDQIAQILKLTLPHKSRPESSPLLKAIAADADAQLLISFPADLVEALWKPDNIPQVILSQTFKHQVRYSLPPSPPSSFFPLPTPSLWCVQTARRYVFLLHSKRFLVVLQVFHRGYTA